MPGDRCAKPARWRARCCCARPPNNGSEAGDLSTRDGFVLHPDGRRLGYGELAARAACVGAGIDAGDVRLKQPKEFRLIGQPVPRRDSPSKVNGSALFGIDARRARHAVRRLRWRPWWAPACRPSTRARSMAMPGVVKVVDVSSALPRSFPAPAPASRWWRRPGGRRSRRRWRCR
jgi:isoquinoline 1-oxidoreductase beta subunit